MLKILRFSHGEAPNTRVFFWGCTHVFHQQPFIWKDRGHSSVEEHADSILTKINNKCTQNDILIHLGDGFLNSTPEMVDEFLGFINPRVYYLWGNHESSMTKLYRNIYKKDHQGIFTEIYPLVRKNVTFCGHYLECIVNGQYIVAQHFPLTVWNHSKHGSWHVHSHCHGHLATSSPNHKMGKILETDVDTFPDGPVSFDEIKAIMDTKSIVSVDNLH
jgi:calcineurin-like phosphoesterase family protein